MSARSTLGMLRLARLTRRQMIVFALASAILNGIITASVGAWLGQTYAKYQARKQSIESLVHLVYERRTRAGMVVSALRRGTDLDEVRYRKRAYDESYVDWNKNVMQNIFAICEVTGEHMISGLEKYYEDGLVAAMADVDRCLTKAYDVRVANGDPKAELEKCNMSQSHQFVLDCGATFTNELYKLTKLSFIPFMPRVGTEGRETSQRRVQAACTRVVVAKPSEQPVAAPAAQVAAPPSPAPATAPAQPTVETPSQAPSPRPATSAP
jgi:hypothetical protein